MRGDSDTNGGLSRAGFLAGMGGLGAVALGIGGTAGAAATPLGRIPPGRPAPTGPAGATGRRGVRYRSVCYTLLDGESPGTAWSARRMRHDIRAVARDLHANSVKVTGDGVDRIAATSTEAAEHGLHIWVEPTLSDRPQRETLEHLAESGRHAEALRRQGADVQLSVGCEFWLLVPGIVPGATVLDRIETLRNGTYDPVDTQRKLDDFTARAAKVGRRVFRGRLSYAAAQSDEVDWRLFDIVGIDYYSYFPRPEQYARELRRYLRWGKPLAITEFGTCTYEGAPAAGGMGWDLVDYGKNPPEIIGDPVRSERTQARYLTGLLDVFEGLGLYAAMAFEFLTADAPHRPDSPRHDLDLASYAIVKPFRNDPADPASDWHWEPKEAFRALAARYGVYGKQPGPGGNRGAYGGNGRYGAGPGRGGEGALVIR
ncbi:abortive phage infection protein [Streptomyces sp. NPDC020875]|uniref:abortive phage infection protein n=1 Tax=Streptomyces sp. NPDC020875 TaxID=3154898 RepID=UPI0033E4A0C1